MFSIVVPVHNVRAYLRECLDSILGQSFTDFEILAIDDCSPDRSGEILDEYAARDARVKVRHLPVNVGLGKARDEGVDAATGKYLLFVDSDDTLTPNALEAIAERIEATHDPDILVFDYARTYWTGKIMRNGLAELLAAAGPDAFRIEQQPDLLTLLMVVWNKAYRRDFIQRHGFRFPEGYYEDLPWTYPTMLTAERIAVLDEVCYHYRQRRHGNILRSRNRKHFDVFDQYDRVFAYLDAHPELEQWRTFLFARMVQHYTLILTSPDRVTPDMRKEFFDRAVEAYRRLRPSDYRPATDARGKKIRAIERGDYRAFRALQAGAGLKQRVDRRLATVQRTAGKRVTAGKRSLIRAYYKTELRKPVDENLAVYAAYWARGYSCNPKAVYEEAQRIAPHIRGVWVVKRQFADSMPPGVDYVEEGSPDYYRVMATAKYFVNNVNFPDNIVKRPGTIHLQTQHGTPLKKMGLDLRDYPVAAANMNFKSLMTRCDRWDYLISANRFSTEVWERSYPSAYVSLEVGYPRNDRLVRATADEVARVRHGLSIPDGKTVVLYAPTFRDWARQRFDPPVDLEHLCRRLGDDYVFLVRSHYFSEDVGTLAHLVHAGLVRDMSEYPVIEDLMLAADILLTNYSSVMFDYANLDRPIVIYADDWDTYVRVRGVNFDLMATPPGVVATTRDELADAFLSGRYRDQDAARVRKEFRDRFCEYDDGHAAERVVRRVFLGEEPLPSTRSLRATGVAQEEPGSQADAENLVQFEEAPAGEEPQAD